MKKAIFFLAMLMCAPIYGQDIKSVVDKINADKAKIKSLTADVEIIIRRRAIVYTLNGKLYREGDKNLRLINHMIINNKFMSDIGSNDSYFWFYARRVNLSNMFYANYSEINKTNLKDSLNPLWLIESMNILKIDTSNSTFQKQGDKLVIFQVKTSTRNNKMIKAIVIDPIKSVIVASYLYDGNKRLVTSADITSFYTTNIGLLIPKVIEAKWRDEDVSMTYKFSNFQFNVEIDPKTFKMPELGINKVNLGNTRKSYQGIND